MQVRKAYKFRFYPTDGQKEVLAKTFGCCRFVYNYMLRIRTDAWASKKERIDYHQTSRLLTELKKDPKYEWLKEVSSVPIQQSLRHLNVAFVNFFAKRGKYPTFKKKWHRQHATYMDTGFSWNGKELRLAKMDDPLKIRWSQQIPKGAKVTSVNVSKDSADRYFVSFQCEDMIVTKPEASGQVGIDLGLTHFAILSTGEKVKSPNAFRKYEKRLATLQRRLAKKQKDSKNRAKARLKVAKIQAKISDTRQCRQ